MQTVDKIKSFVKTVYVSTFLTQNLPQSLELSVWITADVTLQSLFVLLHAIRYRNVICNHLTFFASLVNF